MFYDIFNSNLSNYQIFVAICILLSIKMNDDHLYTNRVYFEDFKLNCSYKCFNEAERLILKDLNYDIYYKKESVLKFINNFS